MASKAAKLAIGGAIVVVIGAIGYFAASPWITVNSMRAAAKAGDHRSLSDHIDFPALRESIRGQMSSAMNARMDKPEMRDNPFAGLGMALASSMINQMVDAMVTPQALASAMTSGDFKARQQGAKLTAEDNERFDRMTSSGYESMDRFVVTVNREDAKIEFVMRRRGLFSWQLTDVTLPLPDSGAARPASAGSRPSSPGNYVDPSESALQRAIRRGETDEAVDMIRAGQIRIDAQDSEGNTALHMAAAKGDLRVTQALVHAGAPKDVKNKKGETPNDVADVVVKHLVRP